MKKWLLIGLLAIGCGSVGYSVAHAGEIAKMHQKLQGSKPLQSHRLTDSPSGATRNSGISEIGLERSACYGTCPVYTVMLKSDGTVRYRGEAHVENIGVRTGRIDAYKFEQLAKYIEEIGYLKLDNNYLTGITDASTVYTTVRSGAKRKVVSNYANSGPAKLWGVEQLIDKLVSETKWDVVKGK